MFHRLPRLQAERESAAPQKPPLSAAHATIHRLVERAYDDLIQLMELGHDQAADLIETLTDYQVALAEHSRRAGPDTGSEFNVRYRNSLKRQLDTKVTRLLGSDLFRQFENYRMGVLLRAEAT